MFKVLSKMDYHPKMIEMLVKSTFTGSLAVNLIVPLIATIVVYDFIPHWQIYLWLFLHIILFVARIFTAKKLEYLLKTDTHNIKIYLYVKCIIILLSASLYAILISQLMKYTNSGTPIFILATLIGLLTAGSISTLSSIFHAFSIFVIVNTLPMIVLFLYYEGEMFNIFAYIMIFFLVIFLISGYRQFIILRDAISMRETFEVIYEKSTDGILLLKNGKLKSCNESIIKMLGYNSKHEVLNLNISQMSPKFQPDGRESSEKLKEMIEIVKKDATNIFEWVHLRANGEEFWVEVVLTKIYIGGEELIHTVWRDINERKQKDQLLIQQSRQAAMGEMIGNIAHQWRQPLNSLGLVLQNLNFEYQMGTLDDEFMNRSIDKGKRLTQIMSKTIDDFRNFFKPNKIKEHFKISNSIINTVDLIEASFKNHNIMVQLELEHSIEFLGYPSEFSQVILNLLSNAKDALIANNIENKIVKISLFQKENKIIIELSDNAGGIPKDAINKIFNPYFTTKDEGKGTGIGLYMSKTIIEQNMNGSIKVTNEDSGAKFRIILIPNQI